MQQKLTIAFVMLGAVVSAILSLVLFQTAKTEMRLDFQQRLRDIVGIAALTVDAQVHQTLNQPEQEGSPAYQTIKRQLQKVQQIVGDVHFVYTMRQNEKGEIVFVVDAETNPEEIAHLGEVYDDASDLLRTSFPNLEKPVAEADFYTDKWGTWLTGYAPIYNPAHERVGVIGVDIAASKVVGYEKKLMLLSAIAFLASLAISSLLGLFLGRKLAAPILAIKDSAEQLADGRFDVEAPVRTSDEVGDLAQTFNLMAARLSQSVIDLQNEIQQRKAAERKFRSIFENAMEGIFQSTVDGRLLTVNPELCRMLGYDSPDEMIKTVCSIGDQLYANPQEREELINVLVEQGTVSNFQAKMKKKNGEKIWAELNVRMMVDGDGNPFVEGLLKDISERIEKQNAEKEKQAAKAASEAKSEFLANMSHEIRTPMNAVIGLTDLTLKTNLTARQQDYLKKIRSSSNNLLGIINDILDYSKIEAGRLELEHIPFRLDDVLNNLSNVITLKAESKELEVLFRTEDDVPQLLVGDPLRLGQVLVNLCGNAIKFTDEGHILLSVERDREWTGAGPDTVSLRFSVQDTGIGIRQDKIDRLFDAFTQMDGSTTRRYGGTGLGLSICRSLVSLMGGDIWVKSREREGTTFSFTAHFALQPEDRKRSLCSPKDLRDLRVLVVDDNELSRDILANYLESFSFKADTASSGEEAINLLEASADGDPYDLVLMDWRMPGIDGIEASRRIKSGRLSGKIPAVLMVTAYGREEILERAQHVGIDAFLTKPVNQSLLFNSIMEVFDREECKWETKVYADRVKVPEAVRGAGILVVEDNRINQQVAVELLEDAGFRVQTANDGQQAVEMLNTKENRFDVVLMDIQMPIMDGYQATQKIRTLENANRDVPVIALTAHALESEKQKCLRAGMDGHISKPIRMQELVDELMKLVTAKRHAPSEHKVPEGPADDSGDLPATLPGIDIKAGLVLLRGKKALFRKLLLDFHNDYREIAKQMHHWMRQEDYVQMERVAHTVKGIAGTIGAEELQEASGEVEMAARESSGRAAQSVDVFVEKLTTVMNSIETLLKPSAASSTAEESPRSGNTDRVKLEEVLPEFIRLLKTGDVKAEEHFGNVAECFTNSTYEAEIRTVSRLMNEFEYEEALRVLEGVLEMMKIPGQGGFHA